MHAVSSHGTVLRAPSCCWPCRVRRAETPRSRPEFLPPVTVANPTARRITEWDDYTGRFQATEYVELRARVNGYLQTIDFTDGPIV